LQITVNPVHLSPVDKSPSGTSDVLIIRNSGTNNYCHLDDNDHFLLTKHSYINIPPTNLLLCKQPTSFCPVDTHRLCSSMGATNIAALCFQRILSFAKEYEDVHVTTISVLAF